MNYLGAAIAGCSTNYSDFPNSIIAQPKYCTGKFFAANLTFTVCPKPDQRCHSAAQQPIIEPLADLD